MSMTPRARSSVLAPSLTRIASGRSLMTVRSTPSAPWKSIGAEFFISLGAILAMFSSFFALTASIQSAGGDGHSPSMPRRRADTQEPISPTSGATISTLLSISLGSMSIWMNFFDPGSPQVLPLPCDRSQLRRRSEEHTSELQSLAYLVCRLLLEKKKKNKSPPPTSPHSQSTYAISSTLPSSPRTAWHSSLRLLSPDHTFHPAHKPPPTLALRCRR